MKRTKTIQMEDEQEAHVIGTASNQGQLSSVLLDNFRLTFERLLY